MIKTATPSRNPSGVVASSGNAARSLAITEFGSAFSAAAIRRQEWLAAPSALPRVAPSRARPIRRHHLRHGGEGLSTQPTGCRGPSAVGVARTRVARLQPELGRRLAYALECAESDGSERSIATRRRPLHPAGRAQGLPGRCALAAEQQEGY